ncbi:MAG: hypothetical protein P8179_19475 [Candidatus Thiodiazotropha sp.]
MQACNSRCSVIHPVGDHNHRSDFHHNQTPAIRMVRSTDFFKLKTPPRSTAPQPLGSWAYY